eukprot:TRINITY_DN52876_c0_g2_i2.p1 TRINITY_DN52876_c0_g2~~TRINITY_DN52876_c0_g2_i2.p1  ORF type:complete len:168 (-),score=13.53 TRINITY_DN52876_c0_g2_i2:12-515(-)
MNLPSYGVYALGLGDVVREFSAALGDAPIQRKYPSRDKKFLLPVLSEKERIRRLKECGAYVRVTPTEIDRIRRMFRSSSFCNCAQKAPTSSDSTVQCCTDNSCPCFADGINCHIEGGRYCNCLSLNLELARISGGSIDHYEAFGSCIEIGRAVQQECRDRSRMPSSA